MVFKYLRKTWIIFKELTIFHFFFFLLKKFTEVRKSTKTLLIYITYKTLLLFRLYECIETYWISQKRSFAKFYNFVTCLSEISSAPTNHFLCNRTTHRQYDRNQQKRSPWWIFDYWNEALKTELRYSKVRTDAKNPRFFHANSHSTRGGACKNLAENIRGWHQGEGGEEPPLTNDARCYRLLRSLLNVYLVAQVGKYRSSSYLRRQSRQNLRRVRCARRPTGLSSVVREVSLITGVNVTHLCIAGVQVNPDLSGKNHWKGFRRLSRVFSKHRWFSAAKHNRCFSSRMFSRKCVKRVRVGMRE